MKKVFTYLLVLVVVAIAIFFAKSFFIEIQDVTVSLKWKHQAQFAGMYVADDKRFYKRAGLNVNLKEFDFERSQIDDLTAGIADFALISAEEFLVFVDQGKAITAVAAFYQTSPYVIVSLADSQIKTPADFLNKTLGVKGGKTEEELFYLLLLEKFGIAENRVEMKMLGFAKKEVDDLMDQDADAVGLYRTDQLYFFDQAGADYNIIYPEQYGINISNDILVTTNALIQANPGLVRNFVTSTIKGWEYAIENPAQAVAITLKYVTDENYQDKEYQQHILSNSIPLIQPTTGQQIGFINPSDFDSLYQTMQENNFLDRQFDVTKFYTNDFLR